jgi:hypothetical protein
MQFSTVVLALAATASAAVLPRQSGQGQWYAQLTNGPAPTGLYLTATFTSDDFSGDNKLRNACVDPPLTVATTWSSTSPTTEPVSLTSTVTTSRTPADVIIVDLNLTQTLPNGVTVFGSEPFALTTVNADGSTFNEGVVPVSSAIA